MSISVVEITRPANWHDNGSGFLAHTDIAAVYFDLDGSTGWIFQLVSGVNQSTGFARFNLADGSIIFSGNWANGTNNTVQNLQNFGTTVTLWAQQGNKYYAVEVGSPNFVIHKMIVSPSSTGSFGNGYLSDVATLNGSSCGLTNGISGLYDIRAVNAGGVNYLLLGGRRTSSTGALNVATYNLSIVNVDTMAFVGGFAFPTTFMGETITFASTSGLFADKNGLLWVAVSVSVTSGDTNNLKNGIMLCSWNPSSGVTGAVLNSVTINFVTSSVLGFSVNARVPDTSYNSTTHSVLIGLDPAVVIVDLTSFTQTVFSNASGLLSQDARGGWFTIKQGPQSNTVMALAGTSNPIVFPDITDTLNLINPATLQVINSYNINQLIVNSSVPNKINLTSDEINCLSYSLSKNIVAVNYSSASPVYIISLGLCGAPAPLGNPFLK